MIISVRFNSRLILVGFVFSFLLFFPVWMMRVIGVSCFDRSNV
uniref:Uncharacterized protein n=1 Tax=Rhizophora mucronata TaxID=61149 RepID=A0A2P2QT62_RHIMU